MADTYWFKQSAEKPLFPDLLWSRPERKSAAGKLLIVGGNLHGFVAPAEAFRAAETAGIGTGRMLLPDSLRQFVGKAFAAGELAPSTPSGSFSQKALGELIEQANWADGVLFPGDLGRNSETAILIEKFLEKYVGQVTLTKDAADYVLGLPTLQLNRGNTLLVITMSQLQKLGIKVGLKIPITFGMDLLKLLEALHELTGASPIMIIVKHSENLICAVNGQVSTTSSLGDTDTWRVQTAASASVWWLQNPAKAFEALTTSMYESVIQ